MNVTLTAFSQQKMIAQGELHVLIKTIKLLETTSEPIFVFNDKNGMRIEIDFSDEENLIYKRVEMNYPNLITKGTEEVSTNKPRGRPKLGVVAKEITLLPRQWEWLAAQPGGASATIRRLVDEAKKRQAPSENKRNRLEAAYQFLHEVAGNLPEYEASLRALFANDSTSFSLLTSDWPQDIRHYANRLAFNEKE